MTATMEALLLTQRDLSDAESKHRSAIEQLAIAAERWAETRPDRLSTQLRVYRETKAARAEAAADVRDAERAAIKAGDVCGDCGWLKGQGHDVDCVHAMPRAA